MKRLTVLCALILGACNHTPETAPKEAFYTPKPRPVATQAQKSACADSFDQSLSNLTKAMKIDGTYAMSLPVSEHATAYEGRVSRY